MEVENTYSQIKIVTLPRMRIARYVMISPNPEHDVISHMDRWAQKSGLLDIASYKPRRIGWDFPYVSKEQSEKFGLRGYVGAYVIPEGFEPEPTCCGAQIAYIEEDTYATLTITDPHSDSFGKIPKGFQILLNFINGSEYKTLSWENRLAFEEEYDKDGIHYMDIFVPVK
jgi:hypothetical protein